MAIWRAPLLSRVKSKTRPTGQTVHLSLLFDLVSSCFTNCKNQIIFPHFQNNPGTPKVLVAPPGSSLISQPQHKIIANPTMPKIHIQPGPVVGGQTIQIQPSANIGGQPLFNLTLNPPYAQQGIKRKAGDMDNGE